MKYFLLLLLFISSFSGKSQFINCKVQDAETKQPLYYATVYYGKQPAITFSDSTGNFFVRPEILNEKDSIKIEFIGYKTLV
ncbi:MAG: carboxypeptidase-like regulatory domain-containing protein, partial [Bacteroidota bacterium]|nr:carboxypeptidase-like regulatory domain-containing protein [Bacteroidota bacterium]